MVATLKERPRSGVSLTTQPQRAPEEGEGGWRRRLRERTEAAAPPTAVHDVGVEQAGPQRMDPQTMPPVPKAGGAVAASALGGDTIAASSVAPRSGAYAGAERPDGGGYDSNGYDGGGYGGGYGARYDGTRDDATGDDADDDEPFGVLTDPGARGYRHETYDAGPGTVETDTRTPPRRLAVVGLALLALAVVVALAVWIGTTVLSVTDSVDGDLPQGPSSAPTTGEASASEEEEQPVAAGDPARITSAAVFDPFGDGEPENDDEVPQAFDGDPATAWSTLSYRGSADFGNLKPGVGLVLDLGSAQPVGGVTLTTTTPGIAVEVRTGDAPDGDLESFALATSGTVDGTTELAFDEPVTTQFVLVWVTGLVAAEDGFAGALAEVAVTPAT
jgi:hypothetical protein